MNYKSPIEVFYSDVQLKFEDGVYKAVQAVDIHVDRDELIKALQYDRQQYEKGWADALLKEQEPVKHGRWELVDEAVPQRWSCSKCLSLMWHSDFSYCPSCGAKMDGEEDE